MDLKNVKTWLAILVVAAAGFIVVPGLLSLMGSLIKLLVIVVIAGGACLALAHARTGADRLVRGVSAEKKAALTADSKGNSGEDKHVSS